MSKHGTDWMDIKDIKTLSKEQAEKLAELTSSVFQQGGAWVFQEFDLESGLTRLTRGLSQDKAYMKLRSWRKEKIEQLLRTETEAAAYTLRVWDENPSWKGEGIWQWAQSRWYVSLEEAKKAQEDILSKKEKKCEIFETTVAELPGHFRVH